MKLRYDEKALAGGKALLALGAIGIVVLLMATGFLDISIPDVENPYSTTVIRGPQHCGIKIPIKISFDFSQMNDPGKDQSTIHAITKHNQVKSDNDYVPDPELVTLYTYNSKVGVGDDKTVYAINGITFKSTTTTADVPVKSLNGANFQAGQKSYKVWTSSPVYNPPSSNPSCNNHVTLVQIEVQHWQKATRYYLGADIINLAIHYRMPNFDEEEQYKDSYLFYFYIPFDDFALMEDIRVFVRGYDSLGYVRTITTKTTVRSYWEWKVSVSLWPPGISVKHVKEVEVETNREIVYDWTYPNSYPINNEDKYGSHSYLYMIR